MATTELCMNGARDTAQGHVYRHEECVLCFEPQYRKQFALVPSERTKRCDHSHERYQGPTPNCGPIVCGMCGRTRQPPL